MSEQGVVTLWGMTLFESGTALSCLASLVYMYVYLLPYEGSVLEVLFQSYSYINKRRLVPVGR